MASPALGPSAAREPRSGEHSTTAPDIVGVLVLGCCAGWALVSASGRDARPEGVLLAVLALGAGYAGGRILGTLLPVGAPALGSLAGLALALSTPDVVPGELGPAPPGRTGATAALLTLAVGAACCAAHSAVRKGRRRALALLAAGIAAVGAVTLPPVGSAAGFGVLLCSLAAGRLRRRALCLAGLLLTVAAVAGTTWAVAENALPAGLTASLEGQLTEQRVALWEDALGVAREHPVRGSGPDSFGQVSQAARQATDADGRPHSAPFQMGAEQGLPGAALLASVFVWLLVALWASPRATPTVLTAGAALAALAALACVGNALSFTQVTTGAGLLAGFATARRPG